MQWRILVLQRRFAAVSEACCLRGLLRFWSLPSATLSSLPSPTHELPSLHSESGKSSFRCLVTPCQQTQPAPPTGITCFSVNLRLLEPLRFPSYCWECGLSLWFCGCRLKEERKANALRRQDRLNFKRVNLKQKRKQVLEAHNVGKGRLLNQKIFTEFLPCVSSVHQGTRWGCGAWIRRVSAWASCSHPACQE